jgi:hypothetical protein
MKTIDFEMNMKNYWEIAYFFHTKPSNCNVYFILNTSNFRLDIFQVLNNTLAPFWAAKSRE